MRQIHPVCSSLELTNSGFRRYPYLTLLMTEEILQPIIAAWATNLWFHVFSEELIKTRHDQK